MQKLRKFWIGSVLISLSVFVLGVYYPLANENSDLEKDYSLASLTLTTKPKVPKKFSESAWGNVGAGGYQAAAQWMAANNTKSRKLDDWQKYYLRPHFGDLVDRVEVIYNSTLPDEWVAASFRVDLSKSNAQVYGNKIYISGPYKPRDDRQLILLAHELVHVRQYEELGSLDKFGYQYFKEYERAGQVYRNNRMEKEAFTFERQFALWLIQQRYQYPQQ